MEVKGVAVRAIPEFVRTRYPAHFDDWVRSLPSNARKIAGNPVMTSSWYPLEEALILPTQKICDMFYDGSEKGAWEAGAFSAEIALQGVHKIFVRIGSPHFLIERASRVIAQYYKPCEIVIMEKSPKRAVLHMTRFGEPNHLVEVRIAGWMKRALEISGCTKVRMLITKSLANGNNVTEFAASWT